MKYIRSNSLKRLFSFGRRGFGEENDVGLVVSPCEEHPPRPSWKCFSYEELFDATNDFSSGTKRVRVSLIQKFYIAVALAVSSQSLILRETVNICGHVVVPETPKTLTLCDHVVVSENLDVAANEDCFQSFFFDYFV